MPSSTRRTPEQKIKQKKETLVSSTQTPFMFPLDVTKSFIYMHIIPHKVQVGELLKEVSLKYSEEDEIGEKDENKASAVLKTLSGGSRATPAAQNRSITERSILLPIPEKLSDKISISYNTNNLGVAGAMYSAGQSLTTEPGAAIKSAGGYATRQLLQNASSELGDLFALSSQNVPNPYSTVLFKNVEQRTFDFSYTFAPTSQKESEALREIINNLRFLSLPAEDGYFLDFPYEFEISFVGSDFLYGFSHGYITDLDVEYGADGGSSFFETSVGGAAPAIVKLKFNFKEIYPLSRTMINNTKAESMKVNGVFSADEQSRIKSLPQSDSTKEQEKKINEQTNRLAMSRTKL